MTQTRDIMKAHYRNYLLALSLLMGTAPGLAQNGDMDWSAESLIVSIDGHEAEIRSYLDKSPSTFTWEQVGNLSSRTVAYSVTSSSGSWDPQHQTGELGYALTSANGNATLAVLGTEEGIAMTLTVANAEGTALKTLVFEIATFNPQ